MAEALIFHYRDNDNFLTRLNPNTKLAALITYSLLIMNTRGNAAFFLAFLPVIMALLIKLPLREYAKESLFFIIISILMIITAVLSGQSMIEALKSSISFLAMILASFLLTDTTMPDEMARSLGSALSHIMGSLAYVLSTVMEVTLSMIPLIIDSAIGMYEARKARGASFASHPLRFLTELSLCILSDLIDKAEIYVDALYSRAYDAGQRRYCAPYTPQDWIIIAICILTIVFITSLKIIGV